MGICQRHTEMNEEQIKSYVQTRKKDKVLLTNEFRLLISLRVIRRVIELFELLILRTLPCQPS